MSNLLMVPFITIFQFFSVLASFIMIIVYICKRASCKGKIEKLKQSNVPPLNEEYIKVEEKYNRLKSKIIIWIIIFLVMLVLAVILQSTRKFGI